MIAFVIRPMLAIPLVLTLMSSASADGPADVARKWGLIGTWAVDCATPRNASRGTIVSYEILSDGTAIVRRDRDAEDTNRILDAKISPDHTLTIKTEFPKFKTMRENAIIRDSDSSMHALYNRDDSGSYTIRDSKIVANGMPSPIMHKCQ